MTAARRRALRGTDSAARLSGVPPGLCQNPFRLLCLGGHALRRTALPSPPKRAALRTRPVKMAKRFQLKPPFSNWD